MLRVGIIFTMIGRDGYVWISSGEGVGIRELHTRSSRKDWYEHGLVGRKDLLVNHWKTGEPWSNRIGVVMGLEKIISVFVVEMNEEYDFDWSTLEEIKTYVLATIIRNKVVMITNPKIKNSLGEVIGTSSIKELVEYGIMLRLFEDQKHNIPREYLERSGNLGLFTLELSGLIPVLKI